MVDQLVPRHRGDPRQERRSRIVGVALFVQTQQGHLNKVFDVRAGQAPPEIGKKPRPQGRQQGAIGLCVTILGGGHPGLPVLGVIRRHDGKGYRPGIGRAAGWYQVRHGPADLPAKNAGGGQPHQQPVC